MLLTNKFMKLKLSLLEEVTVWATTVNTAGGNTRLSSCFKPTFGKIDISSNNSNLKFYPQKVKSNDFLKSGRNEDGLVCFSTYEEASYYYNNAIQKLFLIKEKELLDLKDLFVSPSCSFN